MWREYEFRSDQERGMRRCFPIAQAWAIGFIQERAKELGKDKWLDDLWGYWETRVMYATSRDGQEVKSGEVLIPIFIGCWSQHYVR